MSPCKRKIIVSVSISIQYSVRSAIPPALPTNRANTLSGICLTLPRLILSCLAYQNQIDQKHHKSSRNRQSYSALPHLYPWPHFCSRSLLPSAPGRSGTSDDGEDCSRQGRRSEAKRERKIDDEEIAVASFFARDKGVVPCSWS
jgi:hypothetical protein